MRPPSQWRVCGLSSWASRGRASARIAFCEPLGRGAMPAILPDDAVMPVDALLGPIDAVLPRRLHADMDVNFICLQTVVSLGWIGTMTFVFTLLCYAIGKVMLARDRDGDLALRLSFLLNFVEALVGREVKEQNKKANVEVETQVTLEAATRFGRCCTGGYQAIVPTVPSAYRRAARLQAITSSVVLAVLRGICQFLTCRGKPSARPGQRLGHTLRELTDRQLEGLVAKSKSEDPGIYDVELVSALYTIRDAVLVILEQQLQIASEGGLFQPSLFVSAVLHAILRVPALNQELGRQLAMIVERKGGRAGRLASGKVCEALLAAPSASEPAAPSASTYSVRLRLLLNNSASTRSPQRVPSLAARPRLGPHPPHPRETHAPPNHA